MKVIGSRKKLRKLERKVKSLEAEVDELGRKIEAQETKEFQIEKIVSLAAELLTILAAIIAIVEFLT